MGFYVVGVLMIVTSRQANRIGMPAARPVEEPGLPRLDEAAAAAACLAPSIQPTQIELAGDLPDRRSAQVDRSSEQVKA